MILHTIADAKHCLNNRLHQKYALCTTDVAVEIYFRQRFQIDCPSLSRRLSTEEILDCRDRAANLVDDLVETADRGLAPRINKLLGLEMRYFKPLFSYFGKYQLSAYLTFALALQRLIAEDKPESLTLYDYQFNSFLDTNSDMELFMKTVFSNEDARILRYARQPEQVRLKKIRVLARSARNNPLQFAAHVRRALLSRSSRAPDNIKTAEPILVYEPLYDLGFIRETLKSKYLLFYHNGSPNLVGLECSPMTADLTLASLDFVPEGQDQDRSIAVLANDFSSHFKKNLQLYLGAVDCLNKLHERRPIALGVWGLPPITGTGALLFEYLQTQGVKVVGAQHGALYGDAFFPWHVDSDFNRCDFFISYGFTSADLKRLYPKADIQTKILPFGSAGRWANLASRQKKEVDILFPPTMNFSLFKGIPHMPSHVIADRQIALVEYLDSLVDLKVFIKPLMYSGYENSAIWSLLTGLKNAKLIDYLTLTDFLQAHSPKAVVMEYPSQPLYNCLKLDTEIFLIKDKVHPFEKCASQLLAKRVHFSDNVSDTIDQLELFRQGKLDPKRDQSFADHYLRDENAKERIEEFIRTLV